MCLISDFTQTSSLVVKAFILWKRSIVNVSRGGAKPTFQNFFITTDDPPSTKFKFCKMICYLVIALYIFSEKGFL